MGMDIYAALLGRASSGGGGGGGMVIHISEEGVMDKTYQEIFDAVSNGIIPSTGSVLDGLADAYLVAEAGQTGEDRYEVYLVNLNSIGNSLTFVATAPDGYPAYDEP